MDAALDQENDPDDSGLFEHQPGGRYLHLLREVLLTYRLMLRRMTEEAGISGAQFEVLRELALANGRSNVSALAREIDVDPAAITRVVAGLHELGLVARERDESDGRRRPVVLTDDGRRLMVRMHAKMHECESALTVGLEPQSVETTMEVLRALCDALGSTPRRRR